MSVYRTIGPLVFHVVTAAVVVLCDGPKNSPVHHLSYNLYISFDHLGSAEILPVYLGSLKIIYYSKLYSPAHPLSF